MANEHRCEAMPNNAQVWALCCRKKYRDWRLSECDESGDIVWTFPITHCPFCGVALRPAPRHKHPIEYDQQTDPLDDPYDRPWE